LRRIDHQHLTCVEYEPDAEYREQQDQRPDCPTEARFQQKISSPQISKMDFDATLQCCRAEACCIRVLELRFHGLDPRLFSENS
jgi:hypothetical protein